MSSKIDRRKEERRKNRRTLVMPERRTGFDRRSTNHTLGHRVTWHLRSNEFLLAILLILINLLNLGDLVFTYLALSAGYQEANPFLRYLFLNFSPLVGGYVKLALGLLVTIALWCFRKYKRVLEATLLILAIYLLILLFHLYATLVFV